MPYLLVALVLCQQEIGLSQKEAITQRPTPMTHPDRQERNTELHFIHDFHLPPQAFTLFSILQQLKAYHRTSYYFLHWYSVSTAWKTPLVDDRWGDKSKKCIAESVGGRKMHLRNRLKAPRRFDEEEFDDPARIPHSSAPPSPPPPRPPPAKTRIHPSLQPEVIQFNPNLPPAAFPTLDSWLPRAPENNDTKSPSNSPSSSSSSSSRSSPCLDPDTPPIDNKSENLHELMLPASPLLPSPAMDGSNRFTERENIPFTHPHNPMMTSEEAFMLEMQTSDEEESSESMPRGQKRKVCKMIGSTAFWNGLMKSLDCPVHFPGNWCKPWK